MAMPQEPSGRGADLALDPAVARLAPGRLTGRAAVITGAGLADDDVPTIGFGIAATLAVAGAGVVVVDRDAEAARLAVESIQRFGGAAVAVVGDVRSSRLCEEAADAATTEYGRLDVAINNAATLGAASTLDASDDEVLATLNVNLVGPVRVIRACARRMESGGSVVNIASLGALRSWSRLDYAASKGGLLSLTMDLAVQLGPAGIRVNAISPGQAWTPMGKRRLVDLGLDDAELLEARRARASSSALKADGTGWDVGLAALFLAGEDSRWVTGQNLVVDGGQSCLPPGVAT